MGAHVFLTYTTADRALGEQIAKSLDGAGLTVTQPEAATASGAAGSDTLKTALNETDVMVAIVPPEGSPGSNNVSFEIGAAEGLNKPVLAVVKDTAKVSDLRRFRHVSAADLPNLVAQVQAALKRSAEPG